jgi:hypothetical protein
MAIGNPVLKIDTADGTKAAKQLREEAGPNVVEVGAAFGLAPGGALLFLDPETGRGKQLLLLLWHPQVST